MDTSASTRPETAIALRPRTRTKAIIAIAAGAALLLGGGTTLAYWTTSQTLDVGTVTSGDLELGTPTAAVWTLNGAPVADISAVKIVPGDVVVMTQTSTLTLVGDNLEATLTATLEDAVLPSEVTAPAPVVSVAGATDVTALTDANNGAVATVTVTYTFPTSTTNRDLTNASLDFGDVNLTLTQNP